MLALSLLLIFAAGGVWFLKANSQEAEPLPQNERLYTVTRGDITVGIEADGKLAAKRIDFRVSDGIILDKILVRTGQKVQAGDRLAELSVAEAEKNYENHQKTYGAVKENLEALEEEREEYLLSLNWLLENQKDQSYNAYENRYWELQNEIWSIEYNISEAEGKREWSDQGELIDASLNELNEELAAKKAELEKLEADREKQLEDEGNLELQKERQEKKLREYDEKIAAVRAELEAAGGRMEKARSRYVTADGDGVVLAVNYKNGEAVKDGLPVLELGDNTVMSLNLTVEPEDILDVEEGQPAEFFVDAYPDKLFTGEVLSKNLVQNSEGKYEVVLQVHETDSELLDGMSAGATIILKQKKDVLTLQNKAIYLENGTQYVKVRNADGELEHKSITAGFSDGRMSEILEGLSEGDAVLYEDEL